MQKQPKEHIRQHQEMGFLYLEQRELDKAIDEFRQALKQDPSNEQAHQGLGLCYQHSNEFYRAIDEFKEALKINPGNEVALFGLGISYQHIRCFDESISSFKRVIELNPNNALAHEGLGHTYLQEKRYDLAETEFKKSIMINLDSASSHQGLGSIYLERGSYDLAEAEFENTIRLHADSIFAHQMLGYVYKRRGKHDSAAVEFMKATTLYLSKGILNSNINPPANGDNGRSIKILRMPNFCRKGEIHSTELNSSLLPPLALGQITAYLRMHGIKIEQDDLNIRIHYDNHYLKNTDKEIDTSVFFDSDRISRYLSGNEDEGLDSIMENVCRKTRIEGYSIILLSLPIIFSNSSCLLFTLSFSRFLKKRYRTMLILGGANQSVNLLTKYDCKDIDFLIYGDGEVMLLNMLSALGDQHALSEFLHSQVKEAGRLIATKTYPPLKPDFKGLPMDKYRYRGLNSGRNVTNKVFDEFNVSNTLLLPFKFIRGCPHECVFCPESTNKLIYVLEPATVARHIKELQEEYDPTGFFFLSDTINICWQYIQELCDEIIRSKVKVLWTDSARADNLERDTLLKMRQAGCIRLIFGMETASPKLLKFIDKRISLDRLENTLRWADEAGIWTGLEVICGLPYETDKEIEETLEFLNKNRDYINTVYFNQFGLRDGSILLENAKGLGLANIIELNRYSDEEFSDFHKYGYDESEGLKWPDKRMQIVNSQNRLLRDVLRNPDFPIYEFEHFLFFLYNKFGSKQRVSNIFNEAAVEKNELLHQLMLTNGQA